MNPVRAIAIGDSAQHSLVVTTTHPTGFRCLALFQRSFYVELESHGRNNKIICVTTTDLPRGPLSIQVSKNDFDRLRHLPAMANNNWQGMPLSQWLDHRAAVVWNSALTHDAPFVAPEREWLDALLSLCPAESLLHHLDDTPGIQDKHHALAIGTTQNALNLAQRDYFCVTLRQVRQSLAQLLVAADRDAELAAPLIKLAGAGRGLTPAGDDALAGIFIALTVLGKQSVIERLRPIVLPEVSCRTHAISHALLSQAAAGRADESLHRFIANMSQAQLTTVKQSATLLSGMGQTSGWDCLAGMLLAFDAAAQSYTHSSDQQQQSMHA